MAKRSGKKSTSRKRETGKGSGAGIASKPPNTRKRSARTKSKADLSRNKVAPTLNENQIEKIIIWMTQGYMYSNLPSLCAKYLKIDRVVAEELITEARTRITRASFTNRDLELATAITRCNDLYKKSFLKDKRLALLAQKELNKLLKLYDQPVGDGEDGEGEIISEQQQELDAIREHLLPLELAPESYPLGEHARIAAERILNIEPGE